MTPFQSAYEILFRVAMRPRKVNSPPFQDRQGICYRGGMLIAFGL